MAIILGIESSCDDTSAAVLRDAFLLSNVTASQDIHRAYGGVVPELASRAHQQNILPVVSEALRQAGVGRTELSAIAVTFGPGLMGSLLVGTSFAKGLSLALRCPVIAVNHLQAHVLAHFIRRPDVPHTPPEFPYLCLLVSGGNTQIIRVDSPYRMAILGQTIDDAAGEAFDKCAKALGLPYPGGPHVSRLATQGDPEAFVFSKPNVPAYDYSFSGLKTSFLYTLRDRLRNNPDFIAQNLPHLCASLQATIIDILLRKFCLAAHDTAIRHIALAGGVSANAALRQALLDLGDRQGWTVHIPPLPFTTDNAAMVAISGHYLLLSPTPPAISPLRLPPFSRTTLT